MVARLSFNHVLISKDQRRQSLQEFVYSKIAAAWTARNPKYPVLYASEAILAIVRGLHDAWKAGAATGDDIARQLPALFDQDWALLASSEVVTRDGSNGALDRVRPAG